MKATAKGVLQIRTLSFRKTEYGLNLPTSVQLYGFGTFQAKERVARSGRNPATGEAIEISAQNTVTFRAEKVLKDKLNK